MITNNFHLPLHSFFVMLVLVTDTDTDMKLNIILEEIYIYPNFHILGHQLGRSILKLG